jgi:DNA-binding transcriptional LysR family regulator
MTEKGNGDNLGEFTVRAPVARNQWLGVEFRHLAALAAVAREGSFRGAAESLGYVQSAVSQQIAFLERLVGARLVDRTRGPRPVTLTQAGSVMLSHTEGLLTQLEAARVDLQALAHGAAGELRVGMYESIATRVMPALLPRFRSRWPDVHVTTRESGTDAELFRLVDCGQLDVAFADLPLAEGPFDSCDLLSDRYVLVVGAESPLAGHGRLRSTQDLSRLQLIGQSTCRHKSRVESQLRAQALEPEFVFRSDLTATVQALVAAGIGAAILPRLAVDADDPATAVVELGDLLEPRTIALFWHSGRAQRSALDGFRQAAVDVCAEFESDTRAVPLQRRWT